MKNIKRCLDKMNDLFCKEWEQAGTAHLPIFMQILYDDIMDDELHLNIKIFILKLLVNNQKLFKPYAQHWFIPICKFIVSNKTGGKGFHYFLRDLATLLISWTDDFNPEKRDRDLCSDVINTLVKLSADKITYIFNINIEIVASLLHKWAKFVTIDKAIICNMLSVPDSKEGSHLWKMTAIQIVALACSFDIPIRT